MMTISFKRIALFGTLLIGMCTAERSSAQSGNLLFPQMPGVVSYTYRKYFEKDVPSTLDTIKAKGFTDIEFSNLFGKTADELRTMIDERGIKCSSFGVSYEVLVNQTALVAKNAKELGAQYVRVAGTFYTGARH